MVYYEVEKFSLQCIKFETCGYVHDYGYSCLIDDKYVCIEELTNRKLSSDFQCLSL